MINLLPPYQKEELIEEEKLKIVLILGTVLSAFLVSLSLILLLIKSLILSDIQVQKTSLERQEKGLDNQKIKELEKKIKEYNLVTSRLSDFYKSQTDITELMDKISRTIPTGIYLINLTFTATDNKISVSGYSPSRETLLEFKRNLEEVDDFDEVNFPLANWVEPPLGVNFNASFKIK